MKTLALTLSTVIALATANLHAQPPPAAPAQAPLAGPSAVSDEELGTFVAIYVDLLETVEKFEPQIELAQSEAQAQELHVQMQEESLAKVARRGWTPAKFNDVTNAINGDQRLAERAARLIDEQG